MSERRHSQKMISFNSLLKIVARTPCPYLFQLESRTGSPWYGLFQQAVNRVGNAPRVERRNTSDSRSTRGALPTRLNDRTGQDIVSQSQAARLACVLVYSLGLVWPCWASAADSSPIAIKPPAAKVSATNPLDDRYRQVEKMSELERDRLQRNIVEFRQLSPDQQAHYRDLHQKLEADKLSGGKLSNLLSEYTAWLTTLTPSQRDELSQELDPARKVAIVSRFKREQDARYEAAPTETPAGPVGDSRPFFPRGLPPGTYLLPPELSAVMKVIASEIGLERDKSNEEWLLNYYLEVLRTSIQASLGGAREWPDQRLQQKLESAIERRELKDRLQRNPDMKRQAIIHLIFGGIINKAMEEAKAQSPTSVDLQQAFDALDQREQKRLTLLSKFEHNGILVEKYFAGRKDDPRPRLRALKEQLDRMLINLGVPPLQRPSGGNGPPPFPRDWMPDRPDGGRPFDRPPRNGPDNPRRPGNE